MTDPQKTVFISYRREVSSFTARAIYKDLLDNGYDVFMDVEKLSSGKFDQIILNEIENRAHFLVILEVGSLNRCREEGDWLRREIEHAMDHKRNIVPIMVGRFRFDSKWTQRYLTGKLAELPDYNGLRLYHDNFEDKMRKLREKYLARHVSNEEIEEQSELDNMLRALEYYNSADAKWDAGDYEGVIADCTEAMRLNPEFTEAYYSRRGGARIELGDYEGGFADCDEAIRLNPRYPYAYLNRGIARLNQGNLEGAIADFTLSIKLNSPQLHLSYNNRGAAYEVKGDYQRALEAYDEALRIDPQFDGARNNRANLLKKMGRA